jgi:hypothetical protein
MNGGDTSVREPGGSGVCVINSLMVAGPNTKYMLANDAKIEGCSFEMADDGASSAGASLFQPLPPLPTRGLHAGVDSFHSWPSIEMSRSRIGKGLPMPKLLRESVLFNNHFEEPADSGGVGGGAGSSRDLNKVAVVVNGSVVTALAGAPSELAPTSGLCFGPDW